MSKLLRIYITNDNICPIAATVRITSNPKGVLLINSGTCIQRSFYDDIAIFFQRNRYITVQYDYVGVGDSTPSDLSKVSRSIYEWGSKDMQRMSEWIDEHYPGIDKYILGHSMGGQIVGLMKSINSFKKVITIASSYGNVRNFLQPLRKLGMFIALKSIFPLLNWWYGYFPANLLGMGMDWPYGVAEDWRLWNTRYLSLREWMDHLEKPHFFDTVTVPMSSYLLSDDKMATTKAIPHFRIDYPHARMKVVAPRDYEVEALGHFKTFRKPATAFWEEILNELEAE